MAGKLDRFLMGREEKITGRASGLFEVAHRHIRFLAKKSAASRRNSPEVRLSRSWNGCGGSF